MQVKLSAGSFTGPVLSTAMAGGSFSAQQMALMFAAVFVAVMPLDISHLVSAFVGAIAYLIWQTTIQSNVGRSRPKSTDKSLAKSIRAKAGGSPREVQKAPPPQVVGDAGGPNQIQTREVRTLSAMPVAAPTFESVGWDAEVQELLHKIAPTPQSDEAVAKIARTVKKAIVAVLPEADVAGYASGNLLGGMTAFGVAVPEVDIVINVSPQALARHLQGSQSRTARDVDIHRLHKSAIRACTDQLVATGAFKFRRSAFRGPEPKVTMLAPAMPGICEKGIPMNLSVNCETPLYNTALLTESGQIESRATALIVLVKRWAKDRGLCHVSKGHLPPYAWTLLTVYFLQVGVEDTECPLLPPLYDFKVCSSLLPQGKMEQPNAVAVPMLTQRTASETAPRCVKSSVAKLFKDFVQFYSTRFNWQTEAVSVRVGRRGPPDAALAPHVVPHADGSGGVAPTIEDPFRSGCNLGAGMCESSLAHFHSELARAHKLCSEGASLTLLLEPWAPADPEASPEM